VIESVAGGEGLVYRALDTERLSEVALKLLTVVSLADHQRLVERSAPFREISHPNVMRHIEVIVGTALTGEPAPDSDDYDVLYSVAEWVDGHPLAELFDSTDANRLLSYVAGVGRGLHRLHHHRSPTAPHGIVHRDVKPSNVRVTPEGTAVLIDFGVARPLQHSDLTEGVGTYRWRAPEVLSGTAPVTAAVDVWGLGAVAYWTLTGQPPGLDGTAAACEQLVNTPRCRELSDPLGIAAHIAALLATNPAHRPDNLQRWAEQLEAMLSTPRRGRSWLRAACGRGAIAVTALGVGVGLESAAGATTLDRLTPTDVRVDPRIVVVASDGRVEPQPTFQVDHLRATAYRDIATVAERGGAKAVAFVDFDSLTFSDGAAGRANVINSETMQSIAIAPLIDIGVTRVAGNDIPILTRYRVDQLASELAGIGLPSGRRGGFVRSIPALARVTTLEDGEIVSIPDAALRDQGAEARTVVAALALRLAEHADGRALLAPTGDEVRLGQAEVPLEEAELTVRWSDLLNSMDDPAVVSFYDLTSGGVADEVLRDAIVLVGSTDPALVAQLDTPVGPLPEVLIQANALNTVLTEQYSRALPSWFGIVAAGVTAVGIALFSRPRRVGPVVALAVATGWVVTAHFAAADGRRLDVLIVPCAAVASALLVGVRGWLIGWSRRRRMRGLFTLYVAPPIADRFVQPRFTERKELQ
jgi:hypothetical protein